MIVSVILPSLFQPLCERVLASIRNHGAEGVTVKPIVIGPNKPAGDDVLFVHEEKPRGIYHAIRDGVKCAAPKSIIHITCDDVVYHPGWLAKALPEFLAAEQATPKLVMGLRHAGGIGTCYGKMYANFPMFRDWLLDDEFISEHFMPLYLKGQWGDVAFGLGVWAAGGIVKDSGTETLLGWSDRMGQPEAKTKHTPFEKDMNELRRRFDPIFGEGWPRVFRAFNVDCSPDMLRGGTINIPNYNDFVMARVNALNASRKFKVI